MVMSRYDCLPGQTRRAIYHPVTSATRVRRTSKVWPVAAAANARLLTCTAHCNDARTVGSPLFSPPPPLHRCRGNQPTNHQTVWPVSQWLGVSCIISRLTLDLTLLLNNVRSTRDSLTKHRMHRWLAGGPFYAELECY